MNDELPAGDFDPDLLFVPAFLDLLRCLPLGLGLFDILLSSGVPEASFTPNQSLVFVDVQQPLLSPAITNLLC